MFKIFEKLSKPILIALALKHNLKISPLADREAPKNLIESHIATDKCADTDTSSISGCSTVVNECKNQINSPDFDADETTIAILELALKIGMWAIGKSITFTWH